MSNTVQKKRKKQPWLGQVMKNQFFVLGHCVSSVWTPELKKRDQYLEDAMEKEEKKNITWLLQDRE